MRCLTLRLKRAVLLFEFGALIGLHADCTIHLLHGVALVVFAIGGVVGEGFGGGRVLCLDVVEPGWNDLFAEGGRVARLALE